MNRMLLAGIVGVAGLAASAQAVVIVNQLPSDLLNGLISDNVTSGGSRSADDFSVAGGPWNITKLTAVMLTQLPTAPSSATFEIYTDTGAGPTNGAPSFTLAATGATQVGSAFGFKAVEFTVGDGVTPLFQVGANSTSWLSIFGNGGLAYFATYNYGGTPNGSVGYFKSAGFGVPNWAPNTGQGADFTDFAMAVEGTVVPAPSALALLGLGGLVAGRRRR
jgi:hypothetical protein